MEGIESQLGEEAFRGCTREWSVAPSRKSYNSNGDCSESRWCTEFFAHVWCSISDIIVSTPKVLELAGKPVGR